MRSFKFSCPDDLRAKIKVAARKQSRSNERVSESQIVRNALRFYFDAQKEKAA